MKISAAKKEDLLDEIVHRIKSKQGSYVCLPNVYSAVLFQKNEAFRNAMLGADFLIPDGLPLVLVSAIKGQKIDRIRGSDLVLNLCQLSHKYHFSHFFYGSEPGILEKLAVELKKKFPWLHVVGMLSPPFRPVSAEEDEIIVNTINKSNPDILWVALGNPKQEIWMYDHRKKLEAPMMIGVGAAFDFLSGNIKQAPKWVQDCGFEWLFRLVHEPRRLWKRYLIGNVMFLILVLSDLLKTKNPRK